MRLSNILRFVLKQREHGARSKSNKLRTAGGQNLQHNGPSQKTTATTTTAKYRLFNMNINIPIYVYDFSI